MQNVSHWVIGNSSYEFGPLRNPTNDAKDMADALRNLGFDVTQRENLTKRQIEEEVRAFGKKLRAGVIGLFYFSGHAMQLGGSNFLIPVGGNIEKEQDVEFEAVDVGGVVAEMEAAENHLNIVIPDACRNNPFMQTFRSASRGLALMKAPSGTLIAYSTSPGSIASDGKERNGLYTQELLKQIRQPSLKIEEVFKRVRIAVKEKSGGKQLPWETSSLDGEFYFVQK